LPERFPVKKGKIHDAFSWAPPLFEDDRGQLVETWRRDDPNLAAAGFKAEMSYISWTLPGFVRGFHVHPGLAGQYRLADREPKGKLFDQVGGQRDCFLFLDGTYRLVLFDARLHSPSFGCLQQFFVGQNNRLTILVPSGVWHAYKNVGHSRAMVLNFPDALYRGEGRKQEIDELREGSSTPFFDFNWEIVQD
jgi:dTDP-4-dehydrorhamnose 3,5-epimerase